MYVHVCVCTCVCVCVCVCMCACLFVFARMHALCVWCTFIPTEIHCRVAAGVHSGARCGGPAVQLPLCPHQGVQAMVLRTLVLLTVNGKAVCVCMCMRACVYVSC